MAQPPQLDQLAQRRGLLVARSTELRQECAVDLARLGSSATWVETGFRVLRSGQALWPMVTGAAGLMAGRNQQSWLGKAVRIASWIGLGKRVAGIFRSLNGKVRPPEQ